jgi:hypothetical protein
MTTTVDHTTALPTSVVPLVCEATAAIAVIDRQGANDFGALATAFVDHAQTRADPERLSHAYAALRARYASLLTAAQATYAAHRRGAANPLGWLRDELAGLSALPPDGARPADFRPEADDAWPGAR